MGLRSMHTHNITPRKGFDLEIDLFCHEDLIGRVRTDETFAQALYATLCNNQFVHHIMQDPEEYWSCTWRYAGGIVAALRDNVPNEDNWDYLDYYCSGNEGTVHPEVAAMLSEIGWTARPWPEKTTTSETNTNAE